MGTRVLVPYAVVEVDRGLLEVRLDHDDEQIAMLSTVEYQLRQRCAAEQLHGLCIMTTREPDVMWLQGLGLFYRLLFTINAPHEKQGFQRTILSYEVKVFCDRMEVIAGWNASTPFPVLATIRYSETSELDARPLFTAKPLFSDF